MLFASLINLVPPYMCMHICPNAQIAHVRWLISIGFPFQAVIFFQLENLSVHFKEPMQRMWLYFCTSWIILNQPVDCGCDKLTCSHTLQWGREEMMANVMIVVTTCSKHCNHVTHLDFNYLFGVNQELCWLSAVIWIYMMLLRAHTFCWYFSWFYER